MPDNYEQVDKPDHYKGDYVMRIIEDFRLDFCAGNVVKYILRAGRKPGAEILTDLKKAQWYLSRKIEQIENSPAPQNDAE